MKGKDNPMYGRKGLLSPAFGRVFKPSQETKRKNSESHLGKPSGMLGKEQSKKWKEKIIKTNTGKFGKLNGNWKGGTSEPRLRIKQSEKYKQWRQAIFIRDNFTCQKCFKKGGKLEAHHIKRFAVFLQEIKENLPLIDLYEAAMIYSPLWELIIGITLCKECHHKEHRK